MAGKVVRVLERTLYNVTSGQLLAGTASAPIVIAQNVDVSQFLYGQMLLRVHSFYQSSGNQTTNAKVQIDGYRSAPTEEDPSTTFRETTALANFSTSYTWVNGTNPNTGILVDSGSPLNATMGSTIDLMLVITMCTPTAGNLLISVSADLVLKS